MLQKGNAGPILVCLESQAKGVRLDSKLASRR